MEHKNFLPKIQPNTLCEIMGLCTVRMKDDKPFCGVKRLNGSQYEIPLEDVANQDNYENQKIIRSYSSGCVFINNERNEVYLLCTKKKENIQYQFTWWSPSETDLQGVYINDNRIVKLRLDKIYDNAILRTFKRTWAEVIECYNNSPLVDRALIENKDDEGTIFRRLVLLMHFVVKEYTWEVWYTQQEYVVWWKWFDISTLQEEANLAPNAIIITLKAKEIINNFKL